MNNIRNIVKEYMKPEGSLIRNSISFAILMSLIPLVAILTVVSLRVIRSTEWINQFLSGFIPMNVIEKLIDVGLNTNNLGFIPFIVTLGVSYYSASRGFYSIVIAFSYEDVHHQPTFYYTIQSIVAPLVFIVLIVLTIGMNSTIHLLLPNLPIILNTLLSLSVYVFLSLIFFTIIGYPRRHFRDVIPGAVAFSFCMTILANLFFFYINNFTHYSDIYGGLASVMIIILAIKIISSILHICHIINEQYYHRVHNEVE